MQQLQQYNLIAPFMGGQPLTMDQLMNLKLGKPQQGQAQGAPATQGSQPAAAPYGMPMDAGTLPTSQGEPAVAPQNNSPAQSNSPLGQSMMMRMLGFQQTDLQKAQLAAQMLPTGSPERAQADAFVRKLEGYDNSANVRQGGVLLQYDPASDQMKPSFKNPNLPQGFTIDDEGNATVPVNRPSQPSASAAPAAGGIAATNLANNNPGNMKVPGQASQFQKFPDMGSGIGGVAEPAPSLRHAGCQYCIEHHLEGTRLLATRTIRRPISQTLRSEAGASIPMRRSIWIILLQFRRFRRPPLSVMQSRAIRLWRWHLPLGQLTWQSPLDKASAVQTPVQSGSPNIPSDHGTF